tara:strand:- start:397 stop:516 length:120 start_codon:yes stop_codon:yes gene_type:complete
MTREEKIQVYLNLGFTKEEAEMYVDFIGHGDEAPEAFRD